MILIRCTRGAERFLVDVTLSSAHSRLISNFRCRTTRCPHFDFTSRRDTMASSCVGGPLILRLISASIKVVNRAGKIVRDVMSKGELGIVQKGINDLQTEADRSAQQCIISSLSKQFPRVEIIGEETLDPNDKPKEDWIVTEYDLDILKLKCPEDLMAVEEEDVVVWVDPLDGTSEYTQGVLEYYCALTPAKLFLNRLISTAAPKVPKCERYAKVSTFGENGTKSQIRKRKSSSGLLDHVTVLIGIAVHGKAVGSVIHQPFYNYQKTPKADELGRTMWGLIGLGVFGIAHKKPPEDKRIIATTRSHSNDVVQQALNAMEASEIVRVGGAGHKVLLLVEGKAHAYVFASPGCKKWDTCAPEVLLHCVGGCLTDIHGNALQYHKDVQHKNSGGVLATSDKASHDLYIKKIPDDVKKALPP